MFEMLQSYYEEYYKKAVRREKGAMITLTAVLLPLVIGFAGLAFDAGNLYVHKARLQNTADAAALAGGRAYVNSLGTGSNVALTQAQLDAKKPIMIAAADEYIAKNNPLYKEKLDAGQGNTKKSYAIGKETKTENSNKSTEYFRVILTETTPVYLLPVLGIQNVADISVYATAKLSDTEVKVINNEPGTYYDGGEDPLVVAGTLLDLGKNNTFDFKMYITGETKKIDNAIEGEDGKYYAHSSVTGQNTEIDQSKKYNMDKFGEEIRKLFRQLRAERDPGSTDEYYMTYDGSSKFKWKQDFYKISQNPGTYGLKEDEHSYLYLSYSKMSDYSGSGVLKISNFNIGNLYTGTLPSGKKITEDTPYYILVEKDVKIEHVEIESSCTRPVVFCYLRESDSEEIKFEFHNNKYGIQKSIYYAPRVNTWVQINNSNEFRGCIVSNKVRFGVSGGGANNETHLKFDIEEIKKWQEGEDGLKFLPSIGFYDETDPSSGSSSGSGGITETVNEISLPDRLRLVLAGNTTDESHYKDAAVAWTDL